MKALNILFPVLITFFSCSKDKDLSEWNSDRRPQVVLQSWRYTNPAAIDQKGNWEAYDSVFVYYSRDIDYRSYEGLKPDTLYATAGCPIPIEIRKYKIVIP